LQKTKPAEIWGFLLCRLLENMQFADSCKMRKPTPTAPQPKSKLLQENQGFFATTFFTKMKNFFGGFLRFFDF